MVCFPSSITNRRRSRICSFCYIAYFLLHLSVSFGSNWSLAFCDGVMKDAAYDLVATGGTL